MSNYTTTTVPFLQDLLWKIVQFEWNNSMCIENSCSEYYLYGRDLFLLSCLFLKVLKVGEENKKEIDATIYQKVSNIGINHACNAYLKILKLLIICKEKMLLLFQNCIYRNITNLNCELQVNARGKEVLDTKWNTGLLPLAIHFNAYCSSYVLRRNNKKCKRNNSMVVFTKDLISQNSYR